MDARVKSFQGSQNPRIAGIEANIERARSDDLLTVRMSNGSELVYRITETTTSTNYDAPIFRIFGVAEDEQLNIISHSYTDPNTGQELMTIVYSTRHTEG